MVTEVLLLFLQATPDNEINYQFNFGDGRTAVSPTGIVEHRYSANVGVYTYNVVVNATGTGWSRYEY